MHKCKFSLGRFYLLTTGFQLNFSKQKYKQNSKFTLF